MSISPDVPDLPDLTLGSEEATTASTSMRNEQSDAHISGSSDVHVDATHSMDASAGEVDPRSGNQDQDDLFLKNANTRLKDED